MSKKKISRPKSKERAIAQEAGSGQPTSGRKHNTVFAVILAIAALLIISAFIMAAHIVSNGADALKDSYNAAFADEKEAAYQARYEKYYEHAEAQYHVSNQVTISIGDLKETAALEVLKVSDVEYIVEENSANSSNITSWLEVPGEGTYVVDLQAAEFAVDNESSYVLVRLPYPELTNITIDYANVQKLFFKNDLFNDSYKVGEDLAREQLSAADLLIKKEFTSNQYFYLSAQKAAVSTIQCLVKQLNPDIPDLTVEVEFY